MQPIKRIQKLFWERNQHGSIVNKLHLNAFYDVLNRIYTDVLVQTAADYNEFRACATMIDGSKLENVILLLIEDMKTITFLHMQLKKDGNSLYVSKIKIVMELHLG